MILNAVAPGVMKTPVFAAETHELLPELDRVRRMREIQAIVDARNYWLVSHPDTHHTRRVSEVHAHIVASVRPARREFTSGLPFTSHTLRDPALFPFREQKLP